jgi:hypothetical protein
MSGPRALFILLGAIAATLGVAGVGRAASLPVAPCAMTYAVAPSGPNTPPARERAVIPSALAGRLSFYWSPNVGLVAPAGLRCSGFEGADGTTTVRVLPAGGDRRGPGVTVYSIPGCSGCKADLACAYFPAAVRGAPGPCTTKIPSGERLVTRGRHAVVFFDPPGVAGLGQGAGGRLPALSVLAYQADTSRRQGVAAILTCRLPAPQARICQAIVHDYEMRVAP